jgi:anti-anti-sigma factor
MSSSVITVKLPSRFDFSQHQYFSDNIDSWLSVDNMIQLEFDFSQVQYLDSSALGMLIMLAKRAAERNVVVSIRAATGVAYDILMMANMQQLYSINKESAA